ncbi:hypothetical protein QYE76_045044 [Lolium multiflorum]|uniref:Speckle-type POZ protein n=1 Tax=Lolium multiflorum TaxID=4521 RepID=A0AAD8WZF2_LOLMU|nr:hypothetical protein QYE76_045044 [Lolium multiflorum]
MAASHTPMERMASRSTAATARATLALEIVGYSLHKGMGATESIQSAPFSVGGYEWCIRCYLDGINERKEDKDYIPVFVHLLSRPANVRALYDMRLVNKASGLSSPVASCLKSPTVFSTIDGWKKSIAGGLVVRSELEGSALLQDDCLVIECDLTVIKKPFLAHTVEVQMPPPNLSDNLGNLLKTGEEADVTFEVKREVFPAHKIVLAMRSPVFKAELYGPMGDKTSQKITVEDMQPAVFKALLHFIYTDSLPSMEDVQVDDGDDDENKEMVKHLLVAADRYALERLKLMCEGILCKSLDVESVATILALADQHQCSRLKDACVEFVASSNRMDDVVATQGYAHLKRSCPAVLVDIYERVTKSRKI